MARILVIDDDRAHGRSLQKELEDQGEHDVIWLQAVEDGIEALQRSARDGDPYAVAIIDLRFGGDERAGMRIVKEAVQVPFLEPIVLTAYPSDVTAAESLAEGVFRYLTKDRDDFISRTIEAVGLALANRDLMQSLAETIKALRNSVEKLEPGSGVDARDSVNYINICVRYIEDAYGRILRARGRNPDLVFEE